MTIQVENIKPDIGATVKFPREELLDPAVIKRVLELLEERDVLVFPGINLTDKEQLAFTDKLGARVNFTTKVAGGEGAAEPDVYKVTLDPKINDKPEYVLGTFFYHMDGMPIDTIPPPKATLLSARRTAPKGGQTEFASTRAAYAGLSAADKAEFEKLRIRHSAYAGVRLVVDQNPDEAMRNRIFKSEGERPLVWTSKSGVKSLLIGQTADYVVGWDLAVGRALLVRLAEWAGQPAFSYRHEWQEGDLVMWNNCTTLHRVIPYDNNSGRTMHRTSLAGVEALT